MGYVAAGYIAVFGTVVVYSGWAVVQARRAAARVLTAQRPAAEPSSNARQV